MFSSLLFLKPLLPAAADLPGRHPGEPHPQEGGLGLASPWNLSLLAEAFGLQLQTSYDRLAGTEGTLSPQTFVSIPGQRGPHRGGAASPAPATPLPPPPPPPPATLGSGEGAGTCRAGCLWPCSPGPSRRAGGHGVLPWSLASRSASLPLWAPP